MTSLPRLKEDDTLWRVRGRKQEIRSRSTTMRIHIRIEQRTARVMNRGLPQTRPNDGDLCTFRQGFSRPVAQKRRRTSP